LRKAAQAVVAVVARRTIYSILLGKASPELPIEAAAAAAATIPQAVLAAAVLADLE
jgi:hypothetical protein